MIPHHESAVAMAHVALQRATHPDLIAMAKGIVSSQGKEADQMKGWLASWYGATPAAAAAGATSALAVDVTLTEFTVAASQTSFKTNQTYRFTVTNKGVLPHEFMIVPAMSNMGQMDMASLDAVAIAMIPVDELLPGATKTVDVTFTQPAALGGWNSSARYRAITTRACRCRSA